MITREDINNYTEDLLDPSNEEISAQEDLDVRLKTLDWVEDTIDKKVQAAAGQFTGLTRKVFYGGVDAATTSNETLSGIRDLGVDRKVIGRDGLKVLVAGQTNAVDNGLYLMKSGAWQRIAGYTSGASLSGLEVWVNGGDNLGKVYLQPLELPNINTDKPFQVIGDMGAAILSAAGAAKEEVKDRVVPITGSEPDEEGNVTLDYDYQVGSIVNGQTIRRVKWQQSDYGDRTLQRTAWNYDSGTGILSIDPVQEPLPEGGNLLLELVQYGTGNASTGVKFAYIPGDPSTNLGYYFGDEVAPADVKPIPGASVTVVAGMAGKVYSVTSATDGQQFDHDLGTASFTGTTADPYVGVTPVSATKYALSVPADETYTGTVTLTKTS